MLRRKRTPLWCAHDTMALPQSSLPLSVRITAGNPRVVASRSSTRTTDTRDQMGQARVQGLGVAKQVRVGGSGGRRSGSWHSSLPVPTR